MSISVNNKLHMKQALKYLAVSLFLILFNFIYGLFAHGVSSDYMQYAFILPLVGGSLVSLIMMFIPEANNFTKILWQMGITTLIVGSLLHGVFDIYGTEVMLVNVFFISGGILLLGSLITYMTPMIKARS